MKEETWGVLALGVALGLLLVILLTTPIAFSLLGIWAGPMTISMFVVVAILLIYGFDKLPE